MSDFPFKVGDKVRSREEQIIGFYVTVASAPHDEAFAGVGSIDDTLRVYDTYLPWELYAPPPVRRRWTFETEDREAERDEAYLSASVPARASVMWGGRLGVVPVIVPGTLRAVEL